MSKVQVKTTST